MATRPRSISYGQSPSKHVIMTPSSFQTPTQFMQPYQHQQGSAVPISHVPVQITPQPSTPVNNPPVSNAGSVASGYLPPQQTSSYLPGFTSEFQEKPVLGTLPQFQLPPAQFSRPVQPQQFDYQGYLNRQYPFTPLPQPRGLSASDGAVLAANKPQQNLLSHSQIGTGVNRAKPLITPNSMRCMSPQELRSALLAKSASPARTVPVPDPRKIDGGVFPFFSPPLAPQQITPSVQTTVFKEVPSAPVTVPNPVDVKPRTEILKHIAHAAGAYSAAPAASTMPHPDAIFGAPPRLPPYSGTQPVISPPVTPVDSPTLQPGSAPAPERTSPSIYPPSIPISIPETDFGMSPSAAQLSTPPMPIPNRAPVQIPPQVLPHLAFNSPPQRNPGGAMVFGSPQASFGSPPATLAAERLGADLCRMLNITPGKAQNATP